MVNVKKISKKEMERLEAEGVVPKSKKAPQSPSPLPVTTPVPDESIAAAKQIAETARDIAVVAGETATLNAQQTDSLRSIAADISEKLKEKGAQPSWTKLNIKVYRDRNNFIKTADITRVE